MLVLAGPGSGKTFVMVQRILTLIQKKRIDPKSILVISFSKASALELQQRFQKQYTETHSEHSKVKTKEQVNFATFHACFFHILKENCHYTSKDIITEKQKRDIMKTILSDPEYKREEFAEKNINRKISTERKEYLAKNIIIENNSSQKKDNVGKYSTQEKDNIGKYSIQEKGNMGKYFSQEKLDMAEDIEEYLHKISYYKNKGMNALEKTETKQFRKIFHAYNTEMHHQHKLDFDDMGLLCLQLFQSKPDVLALWQKKFQYILIDEYQDINEIQFRNIQLLAKQHENLFVVGDDDQAIYSFRGASPRFMLDFEKYYPTAEKVLLETNFRCSGNIVNTSLQVIEKNRLRFKKEIKAFHNLKEPVELKGFANRQEEYRYITEKINLLIDTKQIPYSDIACIYRTNSDMTGLAEYFIRHKLPFVMKEQCSSIFKHFIAKDILHYLQFFLEGNQRKDFLVIMNKPLRYISRNACVDENISFRELKNYYSSKRYMKKRIEELEQNQRWVQRLDIHGAIYYIRKAMGYEAYLKEYGKSQGMLVEEAMEILNFIHDSTRGIHSLEQWREQIAEYEEALKMAKEEKDGINLITMHACKGLEFPYVFIPDCNEGRVPHKKASAKEEVEEERRMFYVAMTRAKEKLEILYLQDKMKKYLQPSRFLQGITG